MLAFGKQLKDPDPGGVTECPKKIGFGFVQRFGDGDLQRCYLLRDSYR